MFARCIRCGRSVSVEFGKSFKTRENFLAFQNNGLCQSCQDEALEIQQRIETPNPMPLDDPAMILLLDDRTSTPNPSVYRDYCYICKDPEFAQMGLPLCYACLLCGGHVPADDSECDDCGVDQRDVPRPYVPVEASGET